MRTALITTAHGRAQHLHRQLDGISRSARLPDTHVIVTIDDPAVSGVVAASGNAAHVVHCEGPPGPLPVASARNIGALAALNEGAELLVFLDVDCIPGRSLLGRCYEAGVDLEYRDALLCRPVTYLAPPGVEGYPVALERMINPHPARPAPPRWRRRLQRRLRAVLVAMTATTDMDTDVAQTAAPRVFRSDGSGRTCFSSVPFRVGSPG